MITTDDLKKTEFSHYYSAMDINYTAIIKKKGWQLKMPERILLLL